MSGDTLYKTYFSDNFKGENLILFDVMRYNFTRPEFLKIRRQNHLNCHNDLISAPAKLKKAITHLKAEADNQDDDLIPNIDFQENIDEEMVDIKQDLIEEGFTQDFADNFSSPEKFLDFVEEILTSKFTLRETIDGKSINISIDISKFFTDPITDLKKYFPKHVWRDESSWIIKDTSIDIVDYNKNSDSSFNVYSYDTLDIPESLIDTIITFNSYRKVFLKTSYTCIVYRTIDEDCIPIDLADNAGNVITIDDIEELIDSEQFFPYFDDYTLHGIFPEMTRDKWIEICYY